MPWSLSLYPSWLFDLLISFFTYTNTIYHAHSSSRPHTHTHACTNARTHTCTHARTHAHTHTPHTHMCRLLAGWDCTKIKSHCTETEVLCGLVPRGSGYKTGAYSTFQGAVLKAPYNTLPFSISSPHSLSFDVQPPQQQITCCFLSCDAFFVEIGCHGDGHITGAKLVHTHSQV